MNNYIGPISAEWVDPAVELPPDQRVYRVRLASGMECHAGYTTEYGWDGACVVAWLRIGGPSDAIPREAVQAAVDLMEKQRKIMASTPSATDYNEAYADGLIDYHMEIKRHTGVTPTEAQS